MSTHSNSHFSQQQQQQKQQKNWKFLISLKLSQEAFKHNILNKPTISHPSTHSSTKLGSSPLLSSQLISMYYARLCSSSYTVSQSIHLVRSSIHPSISTKVRQKSETNERTRDANISEWKIVSHGVEESIESIFFIGWDYVQIWTDLDYFGNVCSWTV